MWRLTSWRMLFWEIVKGGLVFGALMTAISLCTSSPTIQLWGEWQGVYWRTATEQSTIITLQALRIVWWVLFVSIILSILTTSLRNSLKSFCAILLSATVLVRLHLLQPAAASQWKLFSSGLSVSHDGLFANTLLKLPFYVLLIFVGFNCASLALFLTRQQKRIAGYTRIQLLTALEDEYKKLKTARFSFVASLAVATFVLPILYSPASLSLTDSPINSPVMRPNIFMFSISGLTEHEAQSLQAQMPRLAQRSKTARYRASLFSTVPATLPLLAEFFSGQEALTTGIRENIPTRTARQADLTAFAQTLRNEGYLSTAFTDYFSVSLERLNMGLQQTNSPIINFAAATENTILQQLPVFQSIFSYSPLAKVFRTLSMTPLWFEPERIADLTISWLNNLTKATKHQPVFVFGGYEIRNELDTKSLARIDTTLDSLIHSLQDSVWCSSCIIFVTGNYSGKPAQLASRATTKNFSVPLYVWSTEHQQKIERPKPRMRVIHLATFIAQLAHFSQNPTVESRHVVSDFAPEGFYQEADDPSFTGEEYEVDQGLYLDLVPASSARLRRLNSLRRSWVGEQNRLVAFPDFSGIHTILIPTNPKNQAETKSAPETTGHPMEKQLRTYLSQNGIESVSNSASTYFFSENPAK